MSVVHVDYLTVDTLKKFFKFFCKSSKTFQLERGLCAVALQCSSGVLCTDQRFG